MFGGVNLKSYLKPRCFRLSFAERDDNTTIEQVVNEAREKCKKVKEIIRTRSED
jgi:hypothetical protein